MDIIAALWLAVIHVFTPSGDEYYVNIHYMDVQSNKELETREQCLQYLERVKKEVKLPAGWNAQAECTTNEPKEPRKRT